MNKLRDYQQAASDAVIEEFKTVNSTLVVLPTGCGKTIVFADIIKRMQPARALVLAHRKELIWQAHDKIEAWTGLSVDVEMGELTSNENALFGKSPVIVGTIQTQNRKRGDEKRMGRFKPEDFGLVVMDECFPAGTTVGGRPIEQIKEGDQVLTGDGQYHTVRTCICRPCFSLVRIKFFSGSELVCTPSHPVLCCKPNGKIYWKIANVLDSEDMVFRLTINEEINLRRVREFLRSINRMAPQDMLQRMPEEKQFPDNGQDQPKVCVGTDEKKQPNEAPGNSGTGVALPAPDEASASRARWQWYASNSPATDDGGSIGMDNRIGNPNPSAPKKWFSDLLQSGCWEFVYEDCAGDRWKFPRASEPESAGSKENIFLGVDWVESVEILEPGSDGKFGGLCPDGRVYNLEVEQSPTYFADGVLVHNCHHSTGDSYQDVIGYYRQNANLKVLGATATPDRADEEALGQVFETAAYDYEILDAIKDGWLVDVTQKFAQVRSLNYAEVRTTAGDLNNGDLASVMEIEENIQGVVQPTLETMFRLPEHTLSKIPVTEWQAYLTLLSPPRRTIVFTVSKLQAEITCEVFNRSIPGKAGWVCDNTPIEKRKELLRDFSEGGIYVVCNCGILTEGYDNPAVEVIAMARATKSRSLYSQMVGRSTRPLPGIVDPWPTADERVNAIRGSAKPACIILDFVGNSGKHRLITTAELLGGKVSDNAIERSRKLAEKLGKEVSMRAILDQEQLQINAEEKDRQKREEARRKAKLVAKVDYHTRFVDPFNLFDLQPVRSRGWDRDKQLSEKQRALLRKQGVDPDSMDYAQGRQVLNELFRRWHNNECTLGQAKILKRYGLPTNGITRDEASGLIDQLARNNWRPLTMKTEVKV